MFYTDDVNEKKLFFFDINCIETCNHNSEFVVLTLKMKRTYQNSLQIRAFFFFVFFSTVKLNSTLNIN